MDIFIGLVWGIMFFITIPIWYPLSVLTDWVIGGELYEYVERTYDCHGIPTISMILEAGLNSPRFMVRALMKYYNDTMYHVAFMTHNENKYLEFLNKYCF